MNIKQERQLAKDETTTSDTLANLADSEDAQTRKYVANNPNTPISVLKRLSSEFPEEIMDNPIFSLLMLEKPDSNFIRLTLARSSTTKPETLEKLPELEEEDLLCAIARNRSTPVRTLEKLANWTPRYSEYDDDLRSSVPAGVAANPNTPLFLLEKLASHHDSFVRQAVARSENTSFEILKKLASRPDITVHIAIAENINTPTSILEMLAVNKDRKLREYILIHPNISDSVLNIIKFIDGRAGVYSSTLLKLANHHKLEIRQMVADHIYTPDNALDQLGQEDDYKILDCITIHPNVSISSLEKLTLRLVEYAKQGRWIEVKKRYGSNLAECYFNLIINSEVNLQTRVELVGLIRSLGVLQKIAQFKNTPPEILLKLSEYNDDWKKLINLWGYLTSNFHTPAKAIERIYFVSVQCNKSGAYKEISIIHDRIYSHQNTPIEIKEQIAKKKKTYQQFIASNPDTSQDILRELAYSSDYKTQKKALNNKNIPIDVLESFAHHEDWGERKNAASCKNAPVYILKMLADDENMWVKAEVAKNHNIDNYIIEKLAYSRDKKIRKNVSLNPNISSDTLDVLAKDEDLEISINAINHHNVSDETVINIADNSNDKLRFAVLNKVISKKGNPSEQLVNKLMNINYRLSVLIRIAENKYTPTVWLDSLAFIIPNKINNDYPVTISGNAYLEIMQKQVADNVNASIGTLEQLAESSNLEISKKARATLKNKFSVSRLHKINI